MTKRDLTFEEMKKPGRVLIDCDRLLEIVPLSRRTILNMEQRGEFPKRFTLSARRVAWDLAEVEAWIDERRSGGGKAAFPGLRNAER